MKTFSPKLDEISENIIYLLSINSRQPISKLSKKLGLNRKIVENRMTKLFEKNYIKYLTISNEGKKLNFTILVKLNKIDNNIINRLDKINGLIKLKETLGIYDISLLFSVYSQDDVENAISEVSTILHKYITAFDVLRHYFEDTLGYKSFCNDTKYLKEYNIMNPKAIDLSFKQDLVLNTLMKKTNISYFELSKKTNISYLKLKKIIIFLIKNDLIRFSVDPNYRKLDLEFHNMFIKIKVNKRINFENNIKIHPRIHWVKFCKGKWDYILSITSRDINEFIDITKEIRTTNKEIILEETSLISKIKTPRKY